MLHKYNNSINLSLNTNFIDDFDQNLLYNSMYNQTHHQEPKYRRSSSISSISTIDSNPRRSSVSSLSSNIDQSTPKKKDQSWLLLLLLGA